MKKQVRGTWGDPAIGFDEDLPAALIITMTDPANVDLDIIRFHCCVRAGIIAKRIEGPLDEASLKTLVLKKHNFAWTNAATESISHDAPTMLQILIQRINPTICVRVSDFNKVIQNCKLSIFCNNIKDMLDGIYSDYQ